MKKERSFKPSCPILSLALRLRKIKPRIESKNYHLKSQKAVIGPRNRRFAGLEFIISKTKARNGAPFYKARLKSSKFPSTTQMPLNSYNSLRE